MPQVTFNGTKINVEFTESSSRQQLNSGENISTLFGKIKKIFSDLKAVCFSGSYNDLSNKPSSLPANGGNADYATNAGNADTLNGMDAESIRSMAKIVESMTSATSSQLADGTYCGIWADAPSYLSDTQGTLIVSNYNTYGEPSLWSHRTFYSPHYNMIWHGFTANNIWYGWKEISTTPIKSTTVNGSTDGFGSLLLWSGSGSIPIAAVGDRDRIFSPFIGSGNYYYLAVRDLAGNAIVNTTASATVFFI